MGLFKKKADPFSERSRALQGEIAALEAQIRELSEREETKQTSSLVEPPSPVVSQKETGLPRRPRVLKEISSAEFKLEADPVLAPDLHSAPRNGGILERIVQAFRGKPTSNPKLVTFLAAGSIQGLRPLRYEKRVARNRLLLFCGILVLLIWGILYHLLR